MTLDQIGIMLATCFVIWAACMSLLERNLR